MAVIDAQIEKAQRAWGVVRTEGHEKPVAMRWGHCFGGANQATQNGLPALICIAA